MNRTRLLQLDAKLNELLEFRGYDDEEQKQGHFLRNAAIGTGGLIAADNAATYMAGRGVEGPVRPGLRGVLDTRQKGVDRVTRYGKTVGDNLERATSGMEGMGFWKRLGKVGRAIPGAFKGVKFSSRHDRLVQLDAKLNSLLSA